MSLFCERFSPFSQEFRGSVGIENPCCFDVSSLSPKRRKGRFLGDAKHCVVKWAKSTLSMRISSGAPRSCLHPSRPNSTATEVQQFSDVLLMKPVLDNLRSALLSFPDLLFLANLEKGRENPPKKTGFFHSRRTPKILGKKGKTQKTRSSSQEKQGNPCQPFSY